MCGISGILNLDFRPIDFNTIKNMSDSLKHRGPDDQGFIGFSFNNNKIHSIDVHKPEMQNSKYHCCIGFNRLSILDLTMNGHQPMISDNERITIAYNGETYNAFEFKKSLQSKGYNFRSKTDTEILLYLYQEYGISKMLNLINGMFAFCIVDMNLKKIFLARDHAGIKPFYWYKNKNTILFASEIKAFLQHPEFNAQVDEKHLPEYQLYNYCTNDRTLFKGVSRIPQGHYLEISVKAENLFKYYEPPFTEKSHLSKNTAQKELEQVFKECVKSQLVSDVKVGCQLSGGIDSSLITTFAKQYFKADMDTFSIIMENQRFSEEKYIEQVIKQTNPIAHRFQLTPDYFARNIISTAWHYDEPLLLPQAIGFKKLAEGASKHVTVLLSGEGSDELMGGYQRYFNLAFRMKNLDYITFLSKYTKKGRGMVKAYWPNLNHRDFFLRKGWFINPDIYKDYIIDEHLNNVLEGRKQLIPDDPDLIKSLRYYETKAWLGALLSIQDKMTMAHSIENRVPFTDRRMFDLIFSLPSKYFVKSNLNPYSYNDHAKNTKILLKRIAESYYNKDFAYRTKMGFDQPLKDYYSNPIMKEFVNDCLLPGIKNRGIYDFKRLKSAWDTFNRDNNYLYLNLFWNCFSFELWAQLFIDKKISA